MIDPRNFKRSGPAGRASLDVREVGPGGRTGKKIGRWEGDLQAGPGDTANVEIDEQSGEATVKVVKAKPPAR